MDPLARFVKGAMLTYPTIFPTRLTVLCHTYLTLGNGHEWSEDGTIRAEKLSNAMKYEDLDTRVERFMESFPGAKSFANKVSADFDVNDFLAKMKSEYEAQVEEERAERQERERNIDVLASTPDTTTVLVYDTDEPGRANHDRNQENLKKGTYGGHYEEAATIIYGLTSTVPALIGRMPKHVEKSFFDGAVEVLNAIIRSTENADERQALIDYVNSLVEQHTTYVAK